MSKNLLAMHIIIQHFLAHKGEERVTRRTFGASHNTTPQTHKRHKANSHFLGAALPDSIMREIS